MQLTVDDERQYLGIADDPYQLNPYLLAENFTVEQLEKANVDKGDIVGKLWQTIEIALTTGDEESIREIREEAAALGFNRNVRPVTRARSAMIAASAGLLALRAEGVMPKSKQVRKAGRSMGSTLGRLHRSEYGRLSTSSFKGIQAEMIAYSLVALNGSNDFLPYLASPREESSRSTQANHDFYTLRFGGSSKLPTQVKYTEVKSSYFVLQLSLRNTLQNHAICKQLGANPVHELAKLIICDSNEHLEPSTDKGSILQLAAQGILDLIKEHKEDITRDTKFMRPPFSIIENSLEEFQASF